MNRTDAWHQDVADLAQIVLRARRHRLYAISDLARAELAARGFAVGTDRDGRVTARDRETVYVASPPVEGWADEEATT